MRNIGPQLLSLLMQMRSEIDKTEIHFKILDLQVSRAHTAVTVEELLGPSVCPITARSRHVPRTRTASPDKCAPTTQGGSACVSMATLKPGSHLTKENVKTRKHSSRMPAVRFCGSGGGVMVPSQWGRYGRGEGEALCITSNHRKNRCEFCSFSE